MKTQTKLEKFVSWIISLFDNYNCEKNRHRWGYKLSESGIVYMDQSKVPPHLWLCLDCGFPKLKGNYHN